MPVTNDMLRTSQMAEPSARPARVGVREKSYSEETITPETALTVSAVLAAFTILCEDLSSLPLILYERRGRNKVRAHESTYYRLMHDQPNPEHTSMVFREFIMGHLLGWGNFFAQPIFDKRGDVVELWPLRPDRMTVKRFEGERVYVYRTQEGKERVFLSEEILHIPAFGFDGLIGYSRIALARNQIGLKMSLDKYGSKLFSNGATPGIVYTHPGELSDSAYDHLKASLEKKTGVDHSHKPIILEEGMNIVRLGLPNDDAQFIETQKLGVSEIARIFRVPPHMIGDVDGSTSWGTGIDSQEQGYVNHTLRPWATRIEQSLNANLLLEKDRSTHYYEHLMDALLRGDIAVRYQAYVHAITNGFMTRNEARERENMNPRKGLDEMLQPLNMTTVQSGGAPESTDPASALAPLWKDAIARVLKREANDILGASRRWQVKGEQGKFVEWLEVFFGGDHVQFVNKQFGPLLEAAHQLSGVDHSAALQAFMQDFLKQRFEDLKDMDAESIAREMNAYISFASEELAAFVSRMSAPDAHDLVEDDYEF